MADPKPLNIYAVVEEQRAALLAREYETVRNVIRAYETAEKKIAQEWLRVKKKLDQAHLTGTPISLAWVYQEARLENLLREVRLRLDDFSKDALEFTEKARIDTYKLGAVHALKLGEASVIGDFAGLHSRAFEAAQAMLHRTSPLTALFQGIGPLAENAARDLFAEGIAKGWNPRKLGRAMSRKIEGLAKNRAILIARTEQIRSYRIANQEVYHRNSDVLRGWRWTSAKTGATCAMCLALDGTVFPTEDKLESHPACRCSMVPLPNTEFPGGPEPTNGEEWFRKRTASEQDFVLGKTKGAMYRRGEFTLGDNVRWIKHPEWGKSPAPRTISALKELRAKKLLPSQVGPVNLSGYEPPAARKLSDLLDATERKAADPRQKALEAWEKTARDKAGTKTTLKAGKTPSYKKDAPKDLSVLMDESTVEDVAIADLIGGSPYVSDAKVKAYIASLGEGPDLPVIVRSGGSLFIHDGDSLARIQAKALLGQTRASVRVYDAEKFQQGAVAGLKAELKALGVTDIIDVQGLSDEEAEAVLTWARDRIKATGADVRAVYGSKSAYVGSDVIPRTSGGGVELMVHVDDVKPGAYVQRNWGKMDDTDRLLQKRDWVLTSDYADSSLWGNNALADFKAGEMTVSGLVEDRIEAGLLRERLGITAPGKSQKMDTLKDFASSRFDLFSARAFRNSDLGEAVEEMIALYRRGEYRIGSLPESIEKPTLKELERLIGKRKTLPAFTDEERILGLQVGGQGGSNPGGMYMGRDGVKRYVKFYPQDQRAEVEQIANLIYQELGVPTPTTEVFTHGGKTAFASDIVEGQVLSSIPITKDLSEQVLDGYIADALLSNWDVAGLNVGDNLLLGADGRVYRIDAGGSLIFRAQGGLKPEAGLLTFEEFSSLGGVSAKGYTGQLKTFLDKAGYSSVDAMRAKLLPQAENALKALKKIGGSNAEAGWEKWITARTPGMSAANRKLIARSMAARTKLLEDKIAYLKQLGKPIKAGKVPKTLQAVLNTPEPPPLARPGTSTREYDAIVRRELGPAMGRMTKEERDITVTYSGSSYDSRFNTPARNGLMNPSIQKLDSAIAKNKEGISQDCVIIRKVQDGRHTKTNWFGFDKTKIGTVISDKGFMSSAIHDGVWSGNTVLRVIMRKGEKRFTAPYGGGMHHNEHEFILGRDLLMIVRDVEHKHGQTILTVEILPENFNLPKGTVIHYAREVLRRGLSLFQKGAELPPGPDGPHSENPDPVEVISWSQCANCLRKREGGPFCDAFPEGIPTEILVGAWDHRRKYEGDLGLTFEQDLESGLPELE